MEKIICFALGLSEEDIEKGKESFNTVSKGEQALDVMAITKPMLASPVIDVMAGLIMDSEMKDAQRCQFPADAILPDQSPFRVMVVNTMEREQVLQIMRCFKAVLPDPQNLIFAVITETALAWTFEEYIGHLAQEHECMKARNSGSK